MTQGYKISWSTLLPSHRACHFEIHPLRVKRILPPFIGLCMPSWTINPSLARADLIVPHEHFLIMSYLFMLLSIQNWLFLKPSAYASSSKRSPELGTRKHLSWTLYQPQWQISSLWVCSPWKERLCLSHFSYLAKGVGLGKDFFVSLR